MILRLFRHNSKIEDQKIIKLLEKIFDKVPRSITEKWIDVHDKSGNRYIYIYIYIYIYSTSKQMIFKTMFQSDLCYNCDSHIVAKGTISVTRPNNNAYYKK